MSEPQHPQSEGTQSAGRGGAVPQPAPGTAYAPLDSLAAVGARLAQLREEKGWSVDDVSARLKVAPNKMRALEAGDISHLPGTTFALGVIRSYAKMLGTDPEPFAQALRRVKGATEPDLSLPASRGADLPRGRVSVPLGSTSKHHHSWWWGVAAAVIVVIALAMWHQGGDSAAWLARLKASAGGMAANPSGTASSTAASAATSTGLVVTQPAVPGAAAVTESASSGPVASGAAPAQNNTPTITPLEPTQPAASQPAGEQGASVATAAPASAPVAGKTQAAAAAQAPTAGTSASQAVQAVPASGVATIAVTVSKDSWFSVRDRNGKEVFSGLVHAGDTKQVSGAPPFKITAGNRAGLESMTLDGHSVDAAKFGPNKGNVARFTLP